MQLHFETLGQGDPLIVMHGMFGSLENLGAVSRILSQHFCLYRLDLRNHGRSPHEATMTFSEMAEDVIAFMDSQGISRASVLGHSLGGKVAMQLAWSHPDRLNKIIIADIAPVTYPQHHNTILDAFKNIPLATITSRKDADKLLSEYVEELGVRQFILKNLARDDSGKFYWRLNVVAILEQYDELRLAIGDFEKDDSNSESPQSCQTPALFIRGEKSNYIQERNYAEIYRKFPNAKIETIQGASHWLHAEEPEKFSSLSIDFLT